MIEINKGQVFIDGRYTEDATLIGLAILDMVEQGIEIKINHE